MLYETVTYMRNGYAKLEYILHLEVNFHYYGFEFFDKLPGYGMYYLVHAMALAASFIIVGFLYRLSALAFFVMFAYLYLQEMTLYLNHFYLVTVMCLIMVVVPCNCDFSVDAWLSGKRQRFVPYWTVWMFQVLISVVYIHAGLAKFNEDWLRCEPLLHWVARRSSLPLVGPLLELKVTACFMSYAGLLFDSFVPLAMVVPVVRPLAFAAAFFFHLSNKLVFNIGIFPWVMIAATTIFFEPDWLPRLFHRLLLRHYPENEYTCVPPVIRAATVGRKEAGLRPLNSGQKLIVVLLAIFFLHQTLLPFRHHLFPGNGIIFWLYFCILFFFCFLFFVFCFLFVLLFIFSYIAQQVVYVFCCGGVPFFTDISF